MAESKSTFWDEETCLLPADSMDLIGYYRSHSKEQNVNGKEFFELRKDNLDDEYYFRTFTNMGVWDPSSEIPRPGPHVINVPRVVLDHENFFPIELALKNLSEYESIYIVHRHYFNNSFVPSIQGLGGIFWIDHVFDHSSKSIVGDLPLNQKILSDENFSSSTLQNLIKVMDVGEFDEALCSQFLLELKKSDSFLGDRQSAFNFRVLVRDQIQKGLKSLAGQMCRDTTFRVHFWCPKIFAFQIFSKDCFEGKIVRMLPVRGGVINELVTHGSIARLTKSSYWMEKVCVRVTDVTWLEMELGNFYYMHVKVPKTFSTGFLQSYHVIAIPAVNAAFTFEWDVHTETMWICSNIEPRGKTYQQAMASRSDFSEGPFGIHSVKEQLEGRVFVEEVIDPLTEKTKEINWTVLFVELNSSDFSFKGKSKRGNVGIPNFLSCVVVWAARLDDDPDLTDEPHRLIWCKEFSTRGKKQRDLDCVPFAPEDFDTDSGRIKEGVEGPDYDLDIFGSPPPKGSKRLKEEEHEAGQLDHQGSYKPREEHGRAYRRGNQELDRKLKTYLLPWAEARDETQFPEHELTTYMYTQFLHTWSVEKNRNHMSFHDCILSTVDYGAHYKVSDVKFAFSFMFQYDYEEHWPLESWKETDTVAFTESIISMFFLAIEKE